MVEATIDIPIPAAVSTPGTSTYTSALPLAAIFVNSRSPTAAIDSPVASTARTPTRLTSLAVARATNMIVSASGRNATPVRIGVSCSTSCRYNELKYHMGNSAALTITTIALVARSGLVSCLNGTSGSDATFVSTRQNNASSARPATIGTSAIVACQPAFSRLRQPVDQHDQAQRQRSRAGDVVGAAFARSGAVGQHRPSHDRSRNANRRVDQQHPTPAERLRDDPADHESSGCDYAADRGPHADRPVKPAARWERGGDDPQRRRRYERGAETLDPAGYHQHLTAHGRAAHQRGDAEQAQRGDEHRSLAQLVHGAATEQQETGERHRIGVDDPLQTAWAKAEVRLDRRQCHDDHGQVEDHHQLRNRTDGQHR